MRPPKPEDHLHDSSAIERTAGLRRERPRPRPNARGARPTGTLHRVVDAGEGGRHGVGDLTYQVAYQVDGILAS
jgi:hypothetical protein